MNDTTPPASDVFHWLVVGYVSPGARQELERVGAHVLPLSAIPSMIAVGIPHCSERTGRYVRGRWQYDSDLLIWNTGMCRSIPTGSISSGEARTIATVLLPVSLMPA